MAQLTGMTSRDPKAVESIDDQEVAMMCWLQYTLPQFWVQLALVTLMYPPPFFPIERMQQSQTFPYILPISLDLFFSLFASYYSQTIPGIISPGLTSCSCCKGLERPCRLYLQPNFPHTLLLPIPLQWCCLLVLSSLLSSVLSYSCIWWPASSKL